MYNEHTMLCIKQRGVVLMSFFSKSTRKRQQPKSSNDVNVVFITNKELSEEQKNAIETIVKKAGKSDEDSTSIEILISMTTGILSVVNFNDSTNSIEVII